MSKPSWMSGPTQEHPWTAEKHTKAWSVHSGDRAVAFAIEREEDARVMAAAPELYEALEEMANSITGAAPPRYEIISKMLERAHAALAKARGESQ